MNSGLNPKVQYMFGLNSVVLFWLIPPLVLTNIFVFCCLFLVTAIGLCYFNVNSGHVIHALVTALYVVPFYALIWMFPFQHCYDFASYAMTMFNLLMFFSFFSHVADAAFFYIFFFYRLCTAHPLSMVYGVFIRGTMLLSLNLIPELSDVPATCFGQNDQCRQTWMRELTYIISL